MIDYEFGPPYEHSELDLVGKWDSTDSITIGFIVAKSEHNSEKPINYSKRSSLLMKRIEEVFLSVSVELVTVFEHPTANDYENPAAEPSELYLEEPTAGIMLIEAERLKPDTDEAMEQCLAAAAEIYGDLMLERVRR